MSYGTYILYTSKWFVLTFSGSMVGFWDPIAKCEPFQAFWSLWHELKHSMFNHLIYKKYFTL